MSALASPCTRALARPELGAAWLSEGPVGHYLDPLARTADRLLRGLLVLDAEAILRYCNRTFAGMLGTAEEQLLGTPVTAHLQAHSHEEFRSRWMAHRRGASDGYAATWLTAAGTPVQTSVLPSPIKAPDGRFLGCLLLTSEGAGQHRLELELTVARRLLDASNAVFVRLRLDERLTVEGLSPNAERLGLPVRLLRAGALGWLDLMVPEDRARALEELHAHVAHEPAAFTQLYRLRPHGAPLKWVECHASLVPAARGAGWLIEGIVTDVTAREEAHERARCALNRTIHTICTVAELRDPGTARHQQRVAALALAIGRRLGLEPDQLEGLYLGALVHDIGKMSVPSELLAKPARLTSQEFELVKTHAHAGCTILDQMELPRAIGEMIAQHHERLDGSGYPQALTAEAIRPEARIIAVADVFEALSAHRPYRPALGVGAALEQLERGAGSVFDAKVVRACAAVVGRRHDTTELWAALEAALRAYRRRTAPAGTDQPRT